MQAYLQLGPKRRGLVLWRSLFGHRLPQSCKADESVIYFPMDPGSTRPNMARASPCQNPGPCLTDSFETPIAIVFLRRGISRITGAFEFQVTNLQHPNSNTAKASQLTTLLEAEHPPAEPVKVEKSPGLMSCFGDPSISVVSDVVGICDGVGRLCAQRWTPDGSSIFRGIRPKFTIWRGVLPK